MLAKFGLPGKPCVLRLICELAESRGLVNTGLLGKALQTIFLLDMSEGSTSTSTLYEYISARTYGEKFGQCDLAYHQCPFSAFNLVDGDFIEKMVP